MHLNDHESWSGCVWLQQIHILFIPIPKQPAALNTVTISSQDFLVSRHCVVSATCNTHNKAESILDHVHCTWAHTTQSYTDAFYLHTHALNSAHVLWAIFKAIAYVVLKQTTDMKGIAIETLQSTAACSCHHGFDTMLHVCTVLCRPHALAVPEQSMCISMVVHTDFSYPNILV